MNESPMRDALLRQEGGDPVERELRMLRELEEKVDRRARRLATATLVVWALWIVAVVLMFLLPVLTARSRPPAGPPAAPAAQARQQGLLSQTATLVASVLVFAGAIGLPVMGLILLILLIATRRSASLSQIRTSLSAIDARLAQLVAAQNAPGQTKDGRGNET